MKTKIAAAVALACFSSFASAQAKQQDASWYIGGSVGRSNADFSAQDFAANVAGVTESQDDHDTGFKLLLGYNFDQHWALEGAFTSLGEPKYKYAGTVGGVTGSGQAELKNDAWSLSIKGTLPVHHQWDLFGRLGWTYNRSELTASFSAANWPTAGTTIGWSASENRSDAVVGVGVEFKPQKNWGIRAEYENYGRFGNKLNTTSDTGRTDMDMWSLGVVVRF